MAEGAHGFGAMNACVQCGAPFRPAVAGQAQCDRCQGLSHPEPSSPLQQAEVAGVRLLHELGAGRYSHSWLGEDDRSHAVVVKLLRRYAPDAAAVERFLQEAQRLADLPDLDHPHLARLLLAGVHLVQAFFLVYESGGELTLADELRLRGHIRPARALELCAQICEGLAAAHRAGVLHLDLKPANVGLRRLSDGTEQAVVLDAITTHLLAHTGIDDEKPLPLASAAFTAPEQVSGAADPRSDLYAVGVLLFQLLSGRLPVTGATAEDLLRAHREHATLRLRDVGHRAHPELEDLIAHLMARDPAARPESGDEAAMKLRAVAALVDVAPAEDERQEPDPMPLPIPVAAARVLAPAVDRGLERAMMRHLSSASPAGAPRVPRWAAFVATRWRYAVASSAAAMLVAGALAVRHVRGKQRELAPAVAGLVPAGVDLPPPSPPSKLAQYAASPWAKNFERAQKALWTNRAAGAQTILNDILRKPDLTRRDRARASKMMGDAFAKKGNRAVATQWWRQAFQLYDDPEERAKVARLIQGQPP